MSETEETTREIRLPSLFWALVPILCMIALMLYVFGWVADADRYDAAHLPLLCSTSRTSRHPQPRAATTISLVFP